MVSWAWKINIDIGEGGREIGKSKSSNIFCPGLSEMLRSWDFDCDLCWMYCVSNIFHQTCYVIFYWYSICTIRYFTDSQCWVSKKYRKIDLDYGKGHKLYFGVNRYLFSHVKDLSLVTWIWFLLDGLPCTSHDAVGLSNIVYCVCKGNFYVDDALKQ